MNQNMQNLLQRCQMFDEAIPPSSVGSSSQRTKGGSTVRQRCNQDLPEQTLHMRVEDQVQDRTATQRPLGIKEVIEKGLSVNQRISGASPRETHMIRIDFQQGQDTKNTGPKGSGVTDRSMGSMYQFRKESNLTTKGLAIESELRTNKFIKTTDNSKADNTKLQANQRTHASSQLTMVAQEIDKTDGPDLNIKIEGNMSFIERICLPQNIEEDLKKEIDKSLTQQSQQLINPSFRNHQSQESSPPGNLTQRLNQIHLSGHDGGQASNLHQNPTISLEEIVQNLNEKYKFKMRERKVKGEAAAQGVTPKLIDPTFESFLVQNSSLAHYTSSAGTQTRTRCRQSPGIVLTKVPNTRYTSQNKQRPQVSDSRPNKQPQQNSNYRFFVPNGKVKKQSNQQRQRQRRRFEKGQGLEFEGFVDNEAGQGSGKVSQSYSTQRNSPKIVKNNNMRAQDDEDAEKDKQIGQEVGGRQEENVVVDKKGEGNVISGQNDQDQTVIPDLKDQTNKELEQSDLPEPKSHPITEQKNSSMRKLLKQPAKRVRYSIKNEEDKEELEILEEKVVGSSQEYSSAIEGLGFNYSHLKGHSTLNTSATKLQEKRQSEILEKQSQENRREESDTTVRPSVIISKTQQMFELMSGVGPGPAPPEGIAPQNIKHDQQNHQCQDFRRSSAPVSPNQQSSQKKEMDLTKENPIISQVEAEPTNINIHSQTTKQIISHETNTTEPNNSSSRPPCIQIPPGAQKKLIITTAPEETDSRSYQECISMSRENFQNMVKEQTWAPQPNPTTNLSYPNSNPSSQLSNQPRFPKQMSPQVNFVMVTPEEATAGGVYSEGQQAKQNQYYESLRSYTVPIEKQEQLTNKAIINSWKGSFKKQITHINQGYRAPAQIQKYKKKQQLRQSEMVQRRNLRTSDGNHHMLNSTYKGNLLSPIHNLKNADMLLDEKQGLNHLYNSAEFDTQNPLLLSGDDIGQNVKYSQRRNMQQQREYGLLGEFFDNRGYIKLHEFPITKTTKPATQAGAFESLALQGLPTPKIQKTQGLVSPQADSWRPSSKGPQIAQSTKQAAYKSFIDEFRLLQPELVGFTNQALNQNNLSENQRRPLSTLNDSVTVMNDQQRSINMRVPKILPMRMAFTPINNCSRVFRNSPNHINFPATDSDRIVNLDFPTDVATTEARLFHQFLQKEQSAQLNQETIRQKQFTFPGVAGADKNRTQTSHLPSRACKKSTVRDSLNNQTHTQAAPSMKNQGQNNQNTTNLSTISKNIANDQGSQSLSGRCSQLNPWPKQSSLDRQTNYQVHYNPGTNTTNIFSPTSSFAHPGHPAHKFLSSNIPSRESQTIEGVSEDDHQQQLQLMFENRSRLEGNVVTSSGIKKNEITVEMDQNSLQQRKAQRKSIQTPRNIVNLKKVPQLKEFEKLIQKGDERIAMFAAKQSSHQQEAADDQVDQQLARKQNTGREVALSQIKELRQDANYQGNNINRKTDIGVTGTADNGCLTQNISRNSIGHPKSAHSKSSDPPMDKEGEKETANEYFISDAVITELGSPSPNFLNKINEKNNGLQSLNKDLNGLICSKKRSEITNNSPGEIFIQQQQIGRNKGAFPSRPTLSKKMRLQENETTNQFTFRKKQNQQNQFRPSNINLRKCMNYDQDPKSNQLLEFQRVLEQSPLSKSSANNYGSIKIVDSVLIVQPQDLAGSKGLSGRDKEGANHQNFQKEPNVTEYNLITLSNLSPTKLPPQHMRPASKEKGATRRCDSPFKNKVLRNFSTQDQKTDKQTGIGKGEKGDHFQNLQQFHEYSDIAGSADIVGVCSDSPLQIKNLHQGLENEGRNQNDTLRKRNESQILASAARDLYSNLEDHAPQAVAVTPPLTNLPHDFIPFVNKSRNVSKEFDKIDLIHKTSETVFKRNIQSNQNMHDERDTSLCATQFINQGMASHVMNNNPKPGASSSQPDRTENKRKSITMVDKSIAAKLQQSSNTSGGDFSSIGYHPISSAQPPSPITINDPGIQLIKDLITSNDPAQIGGTNSPGKPPTLPNSTNAKQRHTKANQLEALQYMHSVMQQDDRVVKVPEQDEYDQKEMLRNYAAEFGTDSLLSVDSSQDVHLKRQLKLGSQASPRGLQTYSLLLPQKPSQIQRSNINYQRQVLGNEKMINFQNVPIDNLRMNISQRSNNHGPVPPGTVSQHHTPTGNSNLINVQLQQILCFGYEKTNVIGDVQVSGRQGTAMTRLVGPDTDGRSSILSKIKMNSGASRVSSPLSVIDQVSQQQQVPKSPLSNYKTQSFQNPETPRDQFFQNRLSQQRDKLLEAYQNQMNIPEIKGQSVNQNAKIDQKLSQLLLMKNIENLVKSEILSQPRSSSTNFAESAVHNPRATAALSSPVRNRMLSPQPTLIKHSKEQRAKYHSYSLHQKIINKSREEEQIAKKKLMMCSRGQGKGTAGNVQMVVQHTIQKQKQLAQWKQRLISDILINQHQQSDLYTKIAGEFHSQIDQKASILGNGFSLGIGQK